MLFSSHKNGHVTAHLTDKECIHLRYPIIPFRQSCSLLLQELGTSMAWGFSPSNLGRSSELAMYSCTHRSAPEVTTLATHHAALQRSCKMCKHMCYMFILVVDILWNILCWNIMTWMKYLTVFSAPADSCSWIRHLQRIKCHCNCISPIRLCKTALQMLNSRPLCLFTELH